MSAFGALNKVLEFRGTSEPDNYWVSEDGAVTLGRQPNLSAVKLAKFRLFCQRCPEFNTRRLQQIITAKVDESRNLVMEMANTVDAERFAQLDLRLDSLIAGVIAQEIHDEELEISKQRIAQTRASDKQISSVELQQLGKLTKSTATRQQPRTVRSFLRPMS